MTSTSRKKLTSPSNLRLRVWAHEDKQKTLGKKLSRVAFWHNLDFQIYELEHASFLSNAHEGNTKQTDLHFIPE
jgi:hypothetical protein